MHYGLALHYGLLTFYIVLSNQTSDKIVTDEFCSCFVPSHNILAVQTDIYFDRIVYFLSYFEYKLALFSFINFYICFILNLYSSAGLCRVPVTLEVGCWNLGVTSLNLQDRLKVLQ